MTARTFILRGLKHYRTGYLGVLLGSALGTMVLLGSLFSGDSVKSTLTTIAEQRIGKTSHVLVGGENLFRSQLAADLGDGIAPVLQLQGQAATSDGRSTGKVDLLGIDERFWQFSRGRGEPRTSSEAGPRDWSVNQALASALDLSSGDTLILRLRKPGLVSHDAPLAGTEDEIITLRGKVTRLVSDDEMGRFSLKATQQATPAVYLPIDKLGTIIGHPERANLLLFPQGSGETDELQARIQKTASLTDYGLSIVEVPKSEALEIRTDRIFLSPAIQEKIRESVPQAHPVLTYLVNTLTIDDRETPYSMVAGIAPKDTPSIPDDLKPNEIVLNQWEADDLKAKAGDPITLSYYTLRNGRLVEESADFTVRSIVPLEGAFADRLWMPDFPGIAEAENNADWSSGLPLDMTRIRDKDETYWDEHRGTPKAFIHYARAEELWGNRWGAATGMRLRSSDIPVAGLQAELLSTLNPTDAGLQVRDVAAESKSAATSPTDIAGLFLSMSFFLILAAIALTAMLFRFNIEQRNRETGLLAALGIAPKKILRWRLGEGLIIVTLGAIIGTALAFAYTQGLLLFLETIWSTRGDRLFRFHAAPASIIGGAFGMIALTMLSIWLTTRKQARQSASLRLEAASEEVVRGKRNVAIWVAEILVVCGILTMLVSDSSQAQAAFFLSGFFFLVSGIAFFKARSNASLQTSKALNIHRLAKLNIARRATRSMVVVGTLASGIFLVISVAAFQKHGGADWSKPSSGAGAFAYWIDTTSALTRLASGKLEIEKEPLSTVLPFGVGAGDDASCFNLNSVAQPRLLATDTSLLEGRFTIKKTAPGIEPTWSSLRTPAPQPSPNAAPPPNSSLVSNNKSPITGTQSVPTRAFVDETTLLWAIKRKIGDRIPYTDDSGATFEIVIAGTLADSVFQGNLIVDEAAFLERFPTNGGYQIFLATSQGEPDTVLPELQRSLADFGATVSTTAARIEGFHGVENTYIAIFHVLGGLGVILGSAGLGLVTARNLAERRQEFHVLNTLGIPKSRIDSLIRREVRSTIGWALGIGLIAALVSIIPALPDTDMLPVLGSISLFVVLILLTASTAAWLAVRKAGPVDS